MAEVNEGRGPVRESITFRIFVSSTFNDLKVERNALQERVFPELRKLCMQHGARFQAIDLRWGVSEEAALDQQTMNLCLSEIRRCQQVTPRPNFIVLLGDRYGWRPLPPQVPAQEFEQIRERVADGDERALLDRWYRRDDNAVPAEYCLEPREVAVADDATEADVEAAREREAAQWQDTEQRLREILLRALAQLDWPDDDARRVKYECSATEQEIREGAMVAGDDHAFCYFRAIDDLPSDASAADFLDLTEEGQADTDARDHLKASKQRLRKHLSQEHVYEYSAQWVGDQVSEAHLDDLCRRVQKHLERTIRAELAGLEEQTELEQEIAAHREFAEDRARHFIGREEIIRQIRDYVSDGTGRPLVTWGPSGSGKSALMARCVEVLATDIPDALLIHRYIGATAASTDIHSLLESLCTQLYSAAQSHYEERKQRRLAEVGGEDADAQRQEVEAAYSITGDARALAKTFNTLIADAPADLSVIIFLDAVDQLSPTDGAHNLTWLPTELPDNVRLVVSALDREGEAGTCLRVLRARLPDDSFVEVTRLRDEEGEALLATWLDEAHRTLQPQQRDDVLSKFEQCPFPLYLKLAFEQARQWKSYDGLPCGADAEPGLSPSIAGVIADMLAGLEQEANHGEVMVTKGLGYLACGRNGLTEDELLDALSLDKTLMADFRRRSPKSPDVDRLPAVVWSRLYFDLEPYLSERAADNTSLLSFYHRQVREAVEQRYLSEERDIPVHRKLGDYFATQQPWTDEEARSSNLRRASELAYQQTRAQDWNGVEATLTDLPSLEAKAEAGMVLDLSADFAGARNAMPTGRTCARHIRLLSQAIARDLQFLARHPTTLFQWLWNRVWWYDCPQAVDHYDPAEGGWGAPGPPWERPEPKLCTLLERWRSKKEKRQPGFVWVRWLRPPPFAVGGGELACLRGHQARVNSVAFDPSGRRVVSGSGAPDGKDNTVRVWDADSGRELACLSGHEGWVNTVAFDSTGRRVVSGSGSSWGEDNTVRVWDADSGEELACLRGHKWSVSSVAFSPDGARIVSGSQDETWRVWDAATGQQLACLRAHKDDVTSVAWDPAGARIVSASDDRTVRVWDAATGQELACLAGHEGPVYSVAWDAAGQRIVSGSWDNTVRVWDAAWRKWFRLWPFGRGPEVACLRGHENIVCSVAWDAAGQRIVSGSWDNTVRVWDAAAGQELACLRGHESWVNSVAWDAAGARIVSGSSDHTVRVWDADRGEAVACLRGHEGGVISMAFAPSGRRVASGSDDTTVRVWAADSGEEVACLRGHESIVWSVAFDPSGRRVVSGSRDKTVRVWDADSGEEIACLRGHEDSVNSVAFDPSGRRVASASEDKTVRVWNADSGEELACLRGHEDTVQSVAFDPSGRRVASGSDDKTVRVWDADSGEELACLRGHEGHVRTVAFDPSGPRVVSGGGWPDNTVRVWDADSGEELARLGGHEGSVYSVAFDPSGQRVVSGSADKTVRVWYPDRGWELACLRGHASDVNSVAFDPSGRRVVSGSGHPEGEDYTVRVWDADSGQELACLRGHEWTVESVAFDPSGRRVVSASWDTTVRVWDADSGEELACLRGPDDWATRVAFDPSGRRVVSGGGLFDKTVRVWEAVTGECLEVIEGRGAAEVIAAGLSEYPWRALRHGLEMVIEDVVADEPIAWFPLNLSDIATHPSGRIWACCGFGSNYLALFALEGPPQVHAPRTVTATRLWRFGAGDAPGHWDDELTALCRSCGRRFEVAEATLGGELPCANCSQPLKLDDFVCDNSDWLT